METQVLISALKKAKKLGISERSITRTFGEETLTVERLLMICDIIDFSLKELESLVGPDIEGHGHLFTKEQEVFLANN